MTFTGSRGQYLEGASWFKKEGYLAEPLPMQLVFPMSPIHFKPIRATGRRVKSKHLFIHHVCLAYFTRYCFRYRKTCAYGTHWMLASLDNNVYAYHHYPPSNHSYYYLFGLKHLIESAISALLIRIIFAYQHSRLLTSFRFSHPEFGYLTCFSCQFCQFDYPPLHWCIFPDRYTCPCYYYPARKGAFVVAVDLPSGKETSDFWVKRGTALLCTLAT